MVVVVVIGHRRSCPSPLTPALQLASRNHRDRRRARHRCCPHSTLVRRSLIRDWSRTYERIWLPQLSRTSSPRAPWRPRCAC
jgi:hypothetical protein